MLISTKGRYALRVMIDLAEHNTGNYVTLSDIAIRQDISEKYLESIVSVLSKKGLVDAVRGKGGGYRLNKEPEEYSVADIIYAIEGSYAPVACLEGEKNVCPRKDKCKTIDMWSDLYKMMDEYFKGKTIADLLKN